MLELEIRFSSLSPERLKLLATFKHFLDKIEEFNEQIVDIYVDGQYISAISETSDIDSMKSEFVAVLLQYDHYRWFLKSLEPKKDKKT